MGLSKQQDPPTLPACPHHLSLLPVIKSLGAHAKAKVSERAKPLNKHGAGLMTYAHIVKKQ